MTTSILNLLKVLPKQHFLNNSHLPIIDSPVKVVGPVDLTRGVGFQPSDPRRLDPANKNIISKLYYHNESFYIAHFTEYGCNLEVLLLGDDSMLRVSFSELPLEDGIQASDIDELLDELHATGNIMDYGSTSTNIPINRPGREHLVNKAITDFFTQ